MTARKRMSQESLPFPTAGSGSIAGRTIGESVYNPKPREHQSAQKIA